MGLLWVTNSFKIKGITMPLLIIIYRYKTMSSAEDWIFEKSFIFVINFCFVLGEICQLFINSEGHTCRTVFTKISHKREFPPMGNLGKNGAKKFPTSGKFPTG